MSALELLREIICEGFLSKTNMQRGRILLDTEDADDNPETNKFIPARVNDCNVEIKPTANGIPHFLIDFVAGTLSHRSGNIPTEVDTVIAFRNFDETSRSLIMTAIEVAVKRSVERSALPRADVISIEAARQSKT